MLNISDNDTTNNLETCLTPGVVDTSLFYIVPDDGLDFTIIEETDFSFTLPTVADNIFLLIVLLS